MTNGNELGKILKQQRVVLELTLRDLATMLGVSSSHLGRIERGERFPSARVLRKIAKPLGFGENELFMLAGYLSHWSYTEDENDAGYDQGQRLDPYVATMLVREPVEMQHITLGILSILKCIANGIAQENSGSSTRDARATPLNLGQT